MRRLERRGEDTDRFEREAQDFHQRVRDEYLMMAKAAPERWLILSAAEPPKTLLDKLIQALKERKWLA
jgi:dTMP kinase